MTPSPIPLSQFGLGCVTFGREIDAAGAAAMMDHAVARGITFFDTAAAYGGGASETIVGQWLRDRRNRHSITLATKILPTELRPPPAFGFPQSANRTKDSTQEPKKLSTGLKRVKLNCWQISSKCTIF